MSDVGELVWRQHCGVIWINLPFGPLLLAVDIDQDDAIALDAIAALFNNAAIESLGSFKGFCSSQNLPSDG
jgi:hypothetical protein